MEKNPLNEAMRELVEEHPELALPATLGHAFPVLPYNVDLKIPENYILSPTQGIMIRTSKSMEPVYDFVIVPTALIRTDKDDEEPMVRLYFWDNQKQCWEKHRTLYGYATLTSTRDISKINSTLQVVVSEEQKSLLAKYFYELWAANERLQCLPTIIRKHRCGWHEGYEFYPYVIHDEESIPKADNKTLLYSIASKVKVMPKGDLEKAKCLVGELGDNPVFAICLAGCLASALVPLIPGKLDENIGIDVAGKTTSGKTTIQKLAVDIVYGLGDILKLSWAKLKDAGVWNMARVCNNLPMILDDTHRMSERHEGIPHDLINGQEGPKSIQTGDGWEGIDPTRSQYKGTLFFNGEVPISSRTPKDSAGIQGRIFMINHAPFPTEIKGSEVEEFKKRGLDNAGHFAKPWIEHLVSLGSNKIYQQVGALDNYFNCAGKDALYGRLATKAQVLVFCLQEFNRLFGTTIDEEKMIELLKQSMDIQTDNVNVADNQMQLIIEKVFEGMAGQKYNEKNCISINYTNQYATLSKPDVCYVKESYLLIKGSTLEEIVTEGGYKSIKAVCEQLKAAGYLKESKASTKRFPPSGNMEKNEARIQGYKFEFADFKKFIPAEE